ncbi:MAG: deoxyhypusine synthase family protein [Candidatus Heimdallarchaeota archaeon]
MTVKKADFMRGRDIIPLRYKKLKGYSTIIEDYEKTCFEARNVAAAAKLLKDLINKKYFIWLGISGAGVVGGLGGYVIDLIEKGFVDAICSTGASVYHDLHHAYALPVKQGSPYVDDNALRKSGIARVYDLFIESKNTLIKQDKIIRKIANDFDLNGNFSSADYNYQLGKIVLEESPYPERSFVAQAAKYGVPIYFDSQTNHSIAMNNAYLFLKGKNIDPSPSMDILESAAIAHSNPRTAFFIWGGGGPKNFIQQTSPTLSQILGIDFKGADCGIQITTAVEKDGGLSGCTFNEGVTWGKYKAVNKNLIQIWGEMSLIIPIIVGYIIENCRKRPSRQVIKHKSKYLEKLKEKLK